MYIYGLQIWGTASKSNIAVIERFQTKMLRAITNAPWFVSNKDIYSDLDLPIVNETIVQLSERYVEPLKEHSNPLAIN